LLFDAGPSFRLLDSGDDIVPPALGASGPSGLDCLIVSHADNDHAGGVVAVLAAFPEADVLEGPDVSLLWGASASAVRLGWDGVHFGFPIPRATSRRAATRARACSR
jgi:competence protein ComEC